MSILINQTEIEGLLIIQPHIFKDDRGIYKKFYEEISYQNCGLNIKFTEFCDIYSKKGAMRGLHYQTKDSQAKLIHVIKGSIFDVAVDLRPSSRTFGKYHAEILNADDHKTLYIPEDFAHGFLSLTDESIFSYQCTGRYSPEDCGGILWNDPELAIEWPLEEFDIKQVICTNKDSNWPTFKSYCERNCI